MRSSSSRRQPQYYERASGCDRMLILMLGLSCIFLTNLVARGGSPCAESMRMIKELRSDATTAPNKLKQALASLTTTTTTTSDKEATTTGGLSALQKKDGKKATSESKPKVVAPSTKNKKSTTMTKTPSSKSSIKKEEEDTTAPSLWKNGYNVVHVLWTRFMQLQPDLMHLGQARIELFKTFTLRSLREQSTQDYTWIIFTDPNLHPTLLQQMVDLVKIDDNILLLGMNVGLMNSGYKNFKTIDWDKSVEKVFSGDLQRIKDYQTAAQNHVYVETRIDADDSVYQDFMRRVQSQASRTLGATAKRAKYNVEALQAKGPEFRVFCAEHHLEWNYFNAWNRSSTVGHLFGVSAPTFCVTAGLTYAFQVGTKPTNLKISHHVLDVEYPICENGSGDSDLTNPDVIGNKTLAKTNCVDRIDAGKFKYVMLRSRTPTSAGMNGVIPTQQVINSKEWAAIQDEVWDKYVLRNFGTTPKSIVNLRQYLTDHMPDILNDALDGQCTRDDFTCKGSSKTALLKLMAQVKMHTSAGGGDSSNSTAAKAPQTSSVKK